MFLSKDSRILVLENDEIFVDSSVQRDF